MSSVGSGVKFSQKYGFYKVCKLSIKVLGISKKGGIVQTGDKISSFPLKPVLLTFDPCDGRFMRKPLIANLFPFNMEGNIYKSGSCAKSLAKSPGK